MTTESLSRKSAIASLKGDSLTTNIDVKGHSVISDEPIEAGGKDLGPTPSQYLVICIAACKAITAKLYAQRKGWNLQSINVKVDYRRETVAAQDDTSNPAHLFETQVRIVGKLDDDQKQRLVAIAARCPISRVVQEGATMYNELVD